MEEGEQSAVVAATSAAAEKLQEAQPKVEKRNFICGVIEGFYGRPWTTEQRKDLFRKLKKWGMDSYVYAPKDDYKHRAYWRELYTVEEADHLTSLIAAARDSGVMFYYALSPGLDMTYSSQKELQTLKRKLDQVSQFGCEAFALLFDDIESELSKADKEVFQTFGNAQVSVTNEIYTHLGNPQFLFCPTQYCSSRAVPTVHDSEYLNTLGSKLNHAIDIMWTGDKVISKNITLESIQEITEVLRRPPVIWDNLHANDYDQKRVFLGPYSGRSPELIPHLRGVMTNPNCEFHANTIAIHTLAYWSQCSMDTKINSSLSADIKLETENEDGTSTEELPADCLSKNVYHPRLALKNAIGEWLSEFFVAKEAWGPITKPQPQVTSMVMPIIPIIPSINTCMSLTTTTTTSATNSKTITAVPEVNTMQLQALADVCSTVNSSSMNPISNAVMNSLVSPTKVVTNDDILNPITTNAASNIELPKKIPISIVSVPIMHSKVIADADLVHNSDALESADQVDVSRQEDLLKEAPPPAAAVKNNVQQVEEAELKDNVEQGTTATITVQEKLNCDKPIEQKEAMHETNNLEGIMIDDKLLQNNNGITAPSNMIVVDAGEALSIDTINMLDEPIITNLSPLSVGNEPMECSSSLASQTSPKEALCKNTAVSTEDVVMVETASLNDNNSMQIESSTPSPLSNADMREVDETLTTIDESKITVEDLYLLCDLFYLPFEHGSRGFRLLNEFNWLKANANVLLTLSKESTRSPSPKPEVAEWLQRAESFSTQCSAVQELLKKIANCANKEICHDLFSYVWDITGALTLLNAFVKWLSLGHFPQNVYTYTQGSYTWFSKGWKEAYMSGDQEPWVFRGGLTADLQRLMPVDSGNDLFLYKLPELPTTDYNVLRPYTSHDEPYVYEVCAHAFVQLTDSEGQTPLPLPSHLRDLIADITVGPFITLSPEMCIVAHDSASNAIVGFAAAAMSVNEFYRNQEMCWMPAMREKYSATSTSGSALLNAQTQFTPCKKLNKMLSAMLAEYQRSDQDSNISRVENECPVEVINSYPAAITAAVLDETLAQDHGIMKRMLTVALATLRANGCFGVHVRLRAKDTDLVQYYTRMGFAEIYNDSLTKYLGRRF